MLDVPDNLFALPETRNLLAEEWALVRSRAMRVAAGPALSLSPLRQVDEVSLATHSRMVRLEPGHSGWVGDLHCDIACLPIESESVQLIVVRHVFDFLERDSGLETELARVLAPGGLLLVFGLNPLSPWRLWCARQAKPGMLVPHAHRSAWLRQRLAGENLELTAGAFVGGPWPSKPGALRVDAGSGQGARWHGAWLLAAHKQRAAARLVRLSAYRHRAVIRPGFVQAPSRRASL